MYTQALSLKKRQHRIPWFLQGVSICWCEGRRLPVQFSSWQKHWDVDNVCWLLTTTTNSYCTQAIISVIADCNSCCCCCCCCHKGVISRDSAIFDLSHSCSSCCLSLPWRWQRNKRNNGLHAYRLLFRLWSPFSIHSLVQHPTLCSWKLHKTSDKIYQL